MRFSYKRGIYRAFTMVEIMMVIAIIGAIAALGIGVFNFASYKIAETKTAGIVNKLDTALNLLYTKYQMYPQTRDDSADKGFLVLGYDPDSADPVVTNLRRNGALKDYPDDYIKDFISLTGFEVMMREFGEEARETSNCYRIVDAWDRPLFYRAPGNVRDRGFDVCSAGLDGMYFTARYIESNVAGTLNMNHIINDEGKSEISVKEAFFSSVFGDDITNY